MVSFKSIAIVLVVLVIVALAASYFYAPSQPASSQDVQRYVLGDLASDTSFAGQNASFEVYSIYQDNQTGQWTATAEIIFNAHLACPTVYLRNYYLLPIRHDIDKLVTSNCQYTTVVAFPEQAIVDSENASQVQQVLNQTPYACGFYLPIADSATVQQYCPLVDYNSLESFAQTLPNQATWVASWTTANSTVFVAMDKTGSIVQTSPA